MQNLRSMANLFVSDTNKSEKRLTKISSREQGQGRRCHVKLTLNVKIIVLNIG